MFLTQTTHSKPAIPQTRSKGISIPPPPHKSVIQCLWAPYELREKLSEKKELSEKIYSILLTLKINEEEIDFQYACKAYHNMTEPVRKRLELLTELEFELLQEPLSADPSAEEDNRTLSRLFRKVKTEREEHQKLYEDLTSSSSYSHSTFWFRNQGGTGPGINVPWAHLARKYPVLMNMTRIKSFPAARLQPETPNKVTLIDKEIKKNKKMEGAEYLMKFNKKDNHFYILPNYLLFFLQLLKRTRSPFLHMNIDSFLAKFLKKDNLHVYKSPFTTKEGRKASDTRVEIPQAEIVKVEPLKRFEGIWEPYSLFSDEEKAKKSALNKEADQQKLKELEKEIDQIDSLRTLRITETAKTYSFGRNESFFLRWHSLGGEMKALTNKMSAASKFFNRVGKRSLTPDWVRLGPSEPLWQQLAQKADELLNASEMRLSKELGHELNPPRGFDAYELWNRKQFTDPQENAVYFPDEGASFRLDAPQIQFFLSRFKTHEWPHYNDFKRSFETPMFTYPQTIGYISTAKPPEFRDFILVMEPERINKSLAFWRALGELIMQSVLVGNWEYKSKQKENNQMKELCPGGFSRLYASDPDGNEVMISTEEALLSMNGYRLFASQMIGMDPEDSSKNTLSKDEIIDILANYLHDFALSVTSAPDFPHRYKKHLDIFHGFPPCTDYAGYMEMIKGMTEILLRVSECCEETMEQAKALEKELENEGRIFFGLMQAVRKTVEKFGAETLRSKIANTPGQFNSPRAFSATAHHPLHINHDDAYQDFDYSKSLAGIRVLLKDKIFLLLLGKLGPFCSNYVHMLLSIHPNIKGIIIGDIYGTLDSYDTQDLGRYISRNKIPLLLPLGSQALSGGGKLFFSGIPATAFGLKNVSFEQLTRVGMHAWLSKTGEKANEIPTDHPKHKEYIQYLIDIGIPPALAREFYYFSIKTPPESIYYLKYEDVEKYQLFNIHFLDKDELLSASLK